MGTETAKTPTGRTALLQAILKVQEEMPQLKKNSTATIPSKSGRWFEYKYITLDEIWAALRPVLTKYGLVVTNKMDGTMLETSLIHVESGESISCAFPINVNQPPQQLGSAFTYARRYALCALLQIVADKDDDGAEAQNAPKAADPY